MNQGLVTALQAVGSLSRQEAATALVSAFAAVGVGNDLEGDVVNSRVARRTGIRQSRQVAAVPAGKVPPGGANLLFDQVEVIKEPLGSRRNPAAALDRVRNQLIGIAEQDRVVRQPRK